MRRVLFAGLLALAPGLAFAQTGDRSANPPPPGMGHGPVGWPHGGHDKWHPGTWSEHMLMKFYAANTTHNGHLTLAQAKAADFKPVVAHFNEIDTAKHGYVTFYDIQAWRLDNIAKHLEARADALRAKDAQNH